MISIVVGFRNRELERVVQFVTSISTQIFKDFELVFVDYGSELELAQSVKEVLRDSPFCTYIYHDSRGKPWSRSHALNIGSLAASGAFLYFTDIDLLFHPNYLLHLNEIKAENRHVYTRVYYLKKGFDSFGSLFTFDHFKHCEISHPSGKGMLLVSRKRFLEIHGYDEFYCDWGVEDNDIHIRLQYSGNEEFWTEHEEFPVYHVWHPPASIEVSFPDKWLDESAYYFYSNRRTVIRNPASFGQSVSLAERTITKLIDSNSVDEVIALPKSGSFNTRTFYYRQIWDAMEANVGKLIKVEIPKMNTSDLSVIQRIVFLIARAFLLTAKSPYVMMYQPEANRNGSFFPERDILWYLRKLEKNSNFKFDFLIKPESHNYTLYLLPYPTG